MLFYFQRHVAECTKCFYISVCGVRFLNIHPSLWGCKWFETAAIFNRLSDFLLNYLFVWHLSWKWPTIKKSGLKCRQRLDDFEDDAEFVENDEEAADADQFSVDELTHDELQCE